MMPDPITPGLATVATTTITVPVLTAFGVNLGLRPDVLVAAERALVAIVLLSSVNSNS